MGICVLKMLGKLGVTEGEDGTSETYYLENMDHIKNRYRQVCYYSYVNVVYLEGRRRYG